MKPVAVAAFVLLLAAGASAQERRQHSHHQPGPPPAPFVPKTLSTGGITTLPPPPPPSPFAAGPNTYAPRYDRQSRFRGGSGYGLGAPVYGDLYSVVPDQPPLASVAPPSPDQSTARAPVPELPTNRVPEPPPVAVAHGPDTFYVIPGCYAGNSPPNPARLPKGCDVARMTTTPIR